MGKEMLLQILMLIGFLVGVTGAARHLMYQFNLMGMRAAPNFMKIQGGLYVLFGLIFVLVVVIQKYVN
jgi:hypothetical protein